MKGLSRKIDVLGRIVIPKEIRNTLNIKENDELEIVIQDKKIILEKTSKLENIKEFVINLVKDVKKIMNTDLIITDKEKNIISDTPINTQLVDIINSNQDQNDIILLIDNKETNCHVNIIRQNFLPVGSVIIDIDNQKLGSFIAQLLSNYLAL